MAKERNEEERIFNPFSVDMTEYMFDEDDQEYNSFYIGSLKETRTMGIRDNLQLTIFLFEDTITLRDINDRYPDANEI